MLLLTRGRPYARTTAGAVALIVLVAGAFLAWALHGLDQVQAGAMPSSDQVLAGLTSDTATNAARLSLGIVACTSLLALAAAVGVSLRRAGARYAAITLFLFLGVVSLGSSAAGLLATQQARNPEVGLLVGVLDLAVVGLLLSRQTRQDFSMAEHERLRHMARSGR